MTSFETNNPFHGVCIVRGGQVPLLAFRNGDAINVHEKLVVAEEFARITDSRCEVRGIRGELILVEPPNAEGHGPQSLYPYRIGDPEEE